MRVHTVTTQANGFIIVTLQPSFVGDATDASDKALIGAYGDPNINVAGSFTDPNNSNFTFQFPTSELYLGVTTQLSTQPAQFCLALPNGPPNAPAPVQGALTCITPNPSEAAIAWQAVMVSRIAQAFAALRSKTLVPSIPDVTI